MICAFVLTAFGSSAEYLEVSFVERPPYIYLNADGSLRGSHGKRLVEIFWQARLDAEWKRFYPRQINALLAADEYQAFIATHNVVRNPDDFYFSQQPLVSLQFFAYQLVSRPQVKKLEDIREAQVAIPFSQELLIGEGQIGSWFGDPDNKIKVLSDVGNLEQAIPMLKTGEIDYYFSYLSPDNVRMRFSTAIRDREISANKVFAAPMYLVVRKSTPASEAMIGKINQVIGR